MNPNLFVSLSGDDADLQQVLTDAFLEFSSQQLAAVREAVERRDTVALERSAHTIKGSLSNFVASEAVQAAQKLESMGRDRDLSQAGEVYRVLERQLLALQSSLTVFQKECVS